jgi:excinuclease UvrABC helicase subunit UvrB
MVSLSICAIGHRDKQVMTLSAMPLLSKKTMTNTIPVKNIIVPLTALENPKRIIDPIAVQLDGMLSNGTENRRRFYISLFVVLTKGLIYPAQDSEY